MSVQCETTDCSEYQIPKDTSAVPDGIEVICGMCGQVCVWPTGTPPLQEEAQTP